MLRFDGAVFEELEAPVDFALAPGDAAMLLVDEFARHPLADAAAGLAAPVRGRVLFDGADWAVLGPREAAARRGRIGRVFTGAAWISNLDLDENVLLAAAHHRRTPPGGAREALRAWARRFGLDELPDTRPAWLERVDAQKAQWVRALYAEPALVVLERPSDGVDADAAAALTTALRAGCARGAAVLWLTANRHLWEKNPMSAPLHGRLSRAGVRWSGAADGAGEEPV